LLSSLRDAEKLEDAETVVPAGEMLYVGSRDLVTVDLRNAERPEIGTTLVDRPTIDRINGMVRLGRYLFAANKEGRIVAFDVRTPEKPRLVGALNVDGRDGVGKPHDIDRLGNLLVVVDPAGFGRRDDPGQVALYKVMDDTNRKVLPVERWSLVGRAASPELVGGNRVRVHGNFAYVAASISPEATKRDQRQAGLAVVDCTDPKKPEFVTSVPFPDGRGPNGMCVAGHAVFVCGGQTIMAVDVALPREPKLLAAFRVTELFKGEPGLDDGHDLVYRDGYLFVTAQTSHAFGVIRINDERIRAAAEGRP
jgi:hypothetical protein